MSAFLFPEREYKGPAIALEEQSLSGSTVGLLRSDSIHTCSTLIPPPVPASEDQYQSSHYPTRSVIPRSDLDADDTPIISLPSQHNTAGGGDSAFVLDNETETLPRKPRPLASFDQFPVIPDPEI